MGGGDEGAALSALFCAMVVKAQDSAMNDVELYCSCGKLGGRIGRCGIAASADAGRERRKVQPRNGRRKYN